MTKIFAKKKKGVNMKRQILTVISVMIFAFFLGALSAICAEIDNDSQLMKYYENFINDKIAKCHSKAQLKDSKLVHLQSCAAKEIKRAAFLSENKEMLIQEMVKRDIGMKQYKIEYFLNKKFYESNGTFRRKI
jgi:hypothetical protein